MASYPTQNYNSSHILITKIPLTASRKINIVYTAQLLSGAKKDCCFNSHTALQNC